ncbi:MAG: anti-sigma factor, partial [Candidatus Dormibacteraeota bacterium]|nr:anti-sigma factor [Candidatus Dormibacteraeota bacterium]
DARATAPRARGARWHPGWAVAAAAILVLAAGGLVLPGLRSRTAPVPAPTAQTVQLAAADGSGATGTGRIVPGRPGEVVELTVRGLPATGPGQWYTCWLVGDGDSLAHPNRVSVGTFKVAGTTPTTVRWATAADPKEYRLEVTLETANGDPARSGPQVLIAPDTTP